MLLKAASHLRNWVRRPKQGCLDYSLVGRRRSGGGLTLGQRAPVATAAPDCRDQQRSSISLPVGIPCYFGHSQPKVPAVSSANTSPSMTCLIVTPQVCPFQIGAINWPTP